MVKQDTVSGELFALTYGAFVRQIIEDYENIEDVNKQLDEIGYFTPILPSIRPSVAITSAQDWLKSSWQRPELVIVMTLEQPATSSPPRLSPCS